MRCRAFLAVLLLTLGGGAHADVPTGEKGTSTFPRAVGKYTRSDTRIRGAGSLVNASFTLFARAGAKLSVGDFPLEVLGDPHEWPGSNLPFCSVANGPCLQTARFTVAGVPMEEGVAVVNRRLSFIGWRELAELPIGFYRLFDYWIAIREEGKDRRTRLVEVAPRYPTDAETVERHWRAVHGYEPDERDIESHVSAGSRLNADIEAWVMVHNYTLEEARAAERRTMESVARQLGVAYFYAFAVSAGVHQLSIDTGAAARSVARAVPRRMPISVGRVLSFTERNLQKGFAKHGADFGLTGNWNPSRAAEFGRAVNQHINSPDVRVITGTYRGNPVTHYLDPKTGLNVIADPAGNYVSGWRLGAEQLETVLRTGRLF